MTSGILHEQKRALNKFLNGLSDKYLPEHLVIDFSTTVHFMDRLLVDRTNVLDNRWVSSVFTKVFRHRLCEFLYLLEVTPDRGRLNIQLDGRSIGLIPEKDEHGLVIKLATCFKGVALNPNMEYSILSLDKEETTNGDS